MNKKIWVLSLLLLGLCSCKGQDSKEIMKAQCLIFLQQLQQQHFAEATAMVAPEFIESFYSSPEQMESLLKDNYIGWPQIGLSMKITEINAGNPGEITTKANKEYAVFNSILQLEFKVQASEHQSSEAEKKLAEEMLHMVAETMSKGRFEIGEISYDKQGNAICKIIEHRKICAILDQSSNRCTFAMSEIGFKSMLKKFLPSTIVKEMSDQL